MRGRLTPAWSLAWALTLAPLSSGAQQIFGPSEERPGVEAPSREAEPPPALDLPAVPAPSEGEPLFRGLEVYVQRFAFEGNTAFSDEDLERVTAGFTGRAISSEDLTRAAQAITDHYVSHGYATSGAVVPDQVVEEGTVRLLIVEGHVSGIEVSGQRWFRAAYFRDRLRRAAQAPVNVERLEGALRRLQRHPQVERLHARLESGAGLGEAVLHLAVEERRPYDLALEGANDRSPALGALGLRTAPSFANLLGHGDELAGSLDLSEGLLEWEGRYQLPLNSYDTTLRLFARESDAEVVEEDFEELGIHSESETYGLSLSHPFWRDEQDQLWVRAVGEWRRLESCLDILPPTSRCTPFSFQPGQPDPEQVASVLRGVQDWSRALSDDVFAARLTWSVGVDLLGATTSGEPDGQFFAWLGQVQWVHRFPEWLLASELLVRGDLQLASDPLLTLEKFSLGGLNTVRGYRENELVRDNGVLGSVEVRVPVLRTGLGRPIVQIVPFADLGHGWDEDGEREDRTLASLGAGLRLSPWPWLRGELFWGGRLRSVPDRGEEYDLQDDGLHFRVVLAPVDALANVSPGSFPW